MVDCDVNARSLDFVEEVESDVDSSINDLKYDLHYETLIENLQRQKENDELCDVVLIVEDEKFPAHRNVLSAFSEYFRKMFTIDMKEKFLKEINIEQVTAEAIEVIINFMYSGQLSISDENIDDILKAASLMQVIPVLKLAKTYMTDNINSGNCCFFRNLAYRYSFKEIQIMITYFILQNFDKVSIETEFLKLSYEEINYFLSSYSLSVHEENNVFEFIVKWIEEDINTRKQYFPSLFKQVRLQSIPVTYVASVIEKNILVRQFHECRDLVGDAVSFYFNPNIINAQNQRKCFSGEPDSISFVSRKKEQQHYINFSKKKVFQITFNGFNARTVLPSCALAEKFPIIILCGGLGENQIPSNQVIRFDGIRWMNIPSMNESKCGAAAVFYGDDLFVFGGEKLPVSRSGKYSQNQNNPDASNFVKDFEQFSFSNDFVWKTVAFPYRSRSYSAALVLDKTIYLIGGYFLSCPNDQFTSEMIPCKVASSTTLKFSPVDYKWEKGPAMNHARAEFGVARLNKKIFVAGGYGTNNSLLNSIEFFDFVNDIWTVITSTFGQLHKIFFGQKLICFNKALLIVQCDKLYMYKEATETFVDLKCNLGETPEVIFPYSLKFHKRPIMS